MLYGLIQPWTMKSQLAEWLGFAADFVASLMEALPVEEQEALRQRRKVFSVFLNKRTPLFKQYMA